MASVVVIDPKVPVMEDLIDKCHCDFTAWLFSDKYGIPLWQNIVMKTLRPILELSCRLEVPLMVTIYENTQPKSPLRYFVVYKILQQINHGKMKLVDFSVLHTYDGFFEEILMAQKVFATWSGARGHVSVDAARRDLRELFQLNMSEV